MARHPKLIALAAGAVAACGFDPLRLWFLALPALGLLAWLVAVAPRRRDALALGWLFGLAHFTVSLNWIATAFTFQANMPAWLGWIAVPLLATYLAVWPALSTWGARAWAGRDERPGPPFLMVLSGLWIATEWLRGWMFTGFPWPPLALLVLAPGDAPGPGVAIASRLVGTYGLSGLVLLAAGIWTAQAIDAARSRRLRLVPAALLAGLPMLALLPVTGLGGAVPPPRDTAVTIVQPNVGQDEINNIDQYESQFQRLAALTVPRPEQRGQPRLVIWPEGAIPDFLEFGYPQVWYRMTTFRASPVAARARIARTIGPGAVLMTGASDVEFANGAAVGARNSVTVLDDRGRIVASYAKAHLVPYGEYLPMRPILERFGLSRLVSGTLDFEPGPGPRTLALPKPFGEAGVQICYEIVFSGAVVDPRSRPGFIVNPSIDGWFGAWGPPQHLAQARLRAIEEGLPVLRATTTGISAIIAASGRVTHRIGSGVAGRIDAQVPAALAPTPFSRLGNQAALGLALLLMLAGIALARRSG